jgi:glucan phosphoethanolaminetransferase (alkaline phosphatase superfamily)
MLQSGIPIEPVLYSTIMFSITMVFVLLYIVFFKVDNETRRVIRLLIILLMMFYIIVHTYNNLDNRLKNDLVTSTFDYYTSVISIFRNLVISDD